MIITWKKVDALEFVAKWQGILLSLQFALSKRRWRVAVHNAAACPDGTFIKGDWVSAPAAMEAVEIAVGRVITREPAPAAAQRPKVDFEAAGLLRHARTALIALVAILALTAAPCVLRAQQRHAASAFSSASTVAAHVPQGSYKGLLGNPDAALMPLITVTLGPAADACALDARGSQDVIHGAMCKPSWAPDGDLVILFPGLRAEWRGRVGEDASLVGWWTQGSVTAQLTLVKQPAVGKAVGR